MMDMISEDIALFAKRGVDFMVTSAPYHANPSDIKVVIESV